MHACIGSTRVARSRAIFAAAVVAALFVVGRAEAADDKNKDATRLANFLAASSHADGEQEAVLAILSNVHAVEMRFEKEITSFSELNYTNMYWYSGTLPHASGPYSVAKNGKMFQTIFLTFGPGRFSPTSTTKEWLSEMASLMQNGFDLVSVMIVYPENMRFGAFFGGFFMPIVGDHRGKGDIAVFESVLTGAMLAFLLLGFILTLAGRCPLANTAVFVGLCIAIYLLLGAFGGSLEDLYDMRNGQHGSYCMLAGLGRGYLLDALRITNVVGILVAPTVLVHVVRSWGERRSWFRLGLLALLIIVTTGLVIIQWDYVMYYLPGVAQEFTKN